jgi:hypothetical protein
MIAPRPGVHPDLPALVALALANENRPATRIEVGLGQRERFLDPKPTTPQHHEQSPKPQPVPIRWCSRHHGNDLVHHGRIGRVEDPDPLLSVRARPAL